MTRLLTRLRRRPSRPARLIPVNIGGRVYMLELPIQSQSAGYGPATGE